MKIINKIKAFFFHQDEPVELDLIAAEIKEGKAYLHPRGEDNVTYLVRSDDIEITLCKGRSISPKDIFKVGPKQRNLEKEYPKEAQKEPKKPAEKEPKVIQRGTKAKETLPTSSDEYSYSRIQLLHQAHVDDSILRGHFVTGGSIEIHKSLFRSGSHAI